MTRTTERPLHAPSVMRAAVEATRNDQVLHAASSLMLLAGLRFSEVSGLMVQDWRPGEDPQLSVGTVQAGRTIRVAQSAATRVDAYLSGEDAAADEPLLIGLRVRGVDYMLPRLFQDAMRQAGLDVQVHDLRRAAMTAVLEAGAPMAHVEDYFGISKTDRSRKDLTVLQQGYDRGIVTALEAAFAP